MHGTPDKTGRREFTGIQLWVGPFALALTGLVLATMLGMEAVVEISYDGGPFHPALTDAGLYFVPLLLVLLYILCCWIRNLISCSR